MTQEYDDPPADVERSAAPDEASDAPQFYNDARDVYGKIFSTNFGILCAGFNDSALGVLIPYIQPWYSIGLLEISYIYLVNFVGGFSASFASIHICSHLGTGGTLVVGVIVQNAGYALMVWAPSYAFFVAAFLLTGFGVTLQDAQANSFTVTVRNSHRWLGVLHAIYGAGTIIGPLVANAVATYTPRWQLFYLVNLVLGVLNVSCIAWTFRHGLFKPNVAGAKETAGRELRETLSHSAIWYLTGFFLLYVGAEINLGAWIVQFLVEVRNGDPEKVGYVASIFWAGFTLGRIALADVTHRFGERRMVFIYIALALAFQLMFWLIPNIIANAISVCLLGFFIGPFYPVGLYVITTVLPQELHLGAIGFTASFGSIGCAIFPFLTGAIASRAGVEALHPIMITLLVGMTIFWAFVPKQGRIQLT
ncbi:major facilitator superfamily domain-containing protein [Aspergillus pseudodeflectus]|uniref:Major facilitator superfamily domain-containing protein n=1 Tax=Aspergillus pseudodeflectus TaxID=176178 RepID=A0ABR4LBY9_9EURO